MQLRTTAGGGAVYLPKRWWSAGKVSHWNWDAGCRTRRYVMGRAGRKRSRSWGTARVGFGTSPRTVGRVPRKCWTSTMPASISGKWDGRCAVRRRPHDGSSIGGTACATDKTNKCWLNWRRSGHPAGRGSPTRASVFCQPWRRMNYQQIHRRGWPIGSGSVESACRQREGQFWTREGMQHLGALTEARHNHHWDQLWSPS